MTSSTKQLVVSPTMAQLSEIEHNAMLQSAAALGIDTDQIFQQKRNALFQNPILLKEFNKQYHAILAQKRRSGPKAQMEAQEEATNLVYGSLLSKLATEAKQEADQALSMKKEQIKKEIMLKQGSFEKASGELGDLSKVVKNNDLITQASQQFKYAKELYEKKYIYDEKVDFTHQCEVLEDNINLARAIFNNTADSLMLLDVSKYSVKDARKEGQNAEELLKVIATIKQCKALLDNPLQADELKLSASQQQSIILKRFNDVVASLASIIKNHKLVVFLAEPLQKAFIKKMEQLASSQQNAKLADELYEAGLKLANESPVNCADEESFFKAMLKNLQGAIEKFRAAKNIYPNHSVAEAAKVNERIEKLKKGHELYVQAENLFQNSLKQNEQKLDVVTQYKLIVTRLLEAKAKFQEAAQYGYNPAIDVLNVQTNYFEVSGNESTLTNSYVDNELLGLRDEIYDRANTLTSKRMPSLEAEIVQLQKVIALLELCNKLDPRYVADELEQQKNWLEFLEQGKILEDLHNELEQGKNVQQNFNVQLGIVMRQASRLGLYKSQSLDNLAGIFSQSMLDSLKKVEQQPAGTSSNTGLLSPSGMLSPVDQDGASMRWAINAKYHPELTPSISPTKS